MKCHVGELTCWLPCAPIDGRLGGLYGSWRLRVASFGRVRPAPLGRPLCRLVARDAVLRVHAVEPEGVLAEVDMAH